MRALPRDLTERLQGGGRDLHVLIVRLGAFGDILRTLPPVRLLRRAAPEARIEWVADDRWAEFLSDHPDLDGVIPFPRAAWRPGSRARALRQFAAWTSSLRGRRADLALDFHGNLRSGLVGALSGAAVRVGYSGHQQREGNWVFSTHQVPAGERRRSRMERNLDLIRALGVPDGPLPDGGIPVAGVELANARDIVRGKLGGPPYAVLSPGASRGQAYKKPPPALLAAAALELAAHGIGVLVTYGPGELTDAQDVVDASGGRAELAPPTTLRELAELLRAARAFVGGDSGPLHLACAVGCPVLAIYGPTDPTVNAPWFAPSVSVHPKGRVYTGVKRLDRSAGGFDGLTAPEIADGIRRLLAATPGGSRESGSG